MIHARGDVSLPWAIAGDVVAALLPGTSERYPPRRERKIPQEDSPTPFSVVVVSEKGDTNSPQSKAEGQHLLLRQTIEGIGALEVGI